MSEGGRVSEREEGCQVPFLPAVREEGCQVPFLPAVRAPRMAPRALCCHADARGRLKPCSPSSHTYAALGLRPKVLRGPSGNRGFSVSLTSLLRLL